MVLLVLASLLFVVGGGWGVGWFGEPPTSRRWSPEAIYWIGWSAILFFGLIALIISTRLFDRRPRIVVDAHGVLWRDFSDDVIPWSRIRSWSVTDMVVAKFVRLEVVDAASFRRSLLASMSGGINRAAGFGNVQITVTGTDRSFAELVDAMRRFGPALPP